MANENEAPGRRLRVLVVDDSELNRELAAAQMEALGHHAAVAADGAEAVRQWAEGGLDVLLMDCDMPVMDGYAATREIRRLEGGIRRTRIVAMTATLSEHEREAARAAGMDEAIEKPAPPALLARVLQGPAVDPAVLAGKGLEALRPRLVAVFLRDAPAQLGQLGTAIQAGDLAQAARSAHGLKGISGNLGAGQMAWLAGTLEEQARDANPAEMPAVFEHLQKEYQRVQDELTLRGPKD